MQLILFNIELWHINSLTKYLLEIGGEENKEEKNIFRIKRADYRRQQLRLCWQQAEVSVFILKTSKM